MSEQATSAQQKTVASVPNAAHEGVLQRKCACGQHTLAGGECEACRKKHGGMMQRAAVNTAPVTDVPPVVNEVLSSAGQPLDVGTRTFMESRFGHDFSHVRVHTDAKAAESAQSVNALAYTVGRDVVFGTRQYAPTTMAGRMLMVHELTHVVQQGANAVAGTPTTRGLSISSPFDNQELAANETASRVMAGAEFTPLNIRQVPSTVPAQWSSGITIQRFQAGETGHGGIEEEALIGKGTGLPDNLQFTSDEESKIYIGNWLRDLSQVPPQAFFLINILALGEFGREITKDELGTYVPSEHLDNPEGGGTIEDPKLTKEQREAKKSELSSEQKKAYEDEEAHMQEIRDAAKSSGLPEYIERGKYHAKQQLAKAIGYGRNSEGLQAMGDGLHAIEDYYSHSNFVEVCIWYLHNKGQLTNEQYTKLVGTEASNDAALLGNMSVPQGGPQIITGTYAPGANSKVSQLELLATEVEHGQLTKAFIKGACRKLGITAKDILKKAAESGRSVGQAVGGAVGGVLGGAVGAVGGAIKGAGEGAAKGWREHSGLSALWHGFTGLFTGAASGAASGARQGWNVGKSVGGAVGGAVGGVIGGAVGLTIDAAIALLGASAMLVLFPVIATLRAAALAALKKGIVEAKVKKNTLQAAQEAKKAGLGPTHAELAKDDPHHHLFKIARALAVYVDRDIGNAMATAWEETRRRDESAKSQQPPSPEVVASVTGLVDKYVSHPATDQWWMDAVKDKV